MIDFETIREKVLQSLRLSEKEALFLFESPRFFEIGQLADIVNFKKNKDAVFYNLNSHLNPTNICVMSCKFCSFARKPGEEGAFAYSIEEILEKAERAVKSGVKEIHMVGGLHPRWSLDYYGQMFRSIKEKYPHIHLKGMTAVEIDWLAKKSRREPADVLLYLKEAGLDSLPGGGAEIFHPDCRDLITAKLSTEKWIDIHRTAHKMGLKTNCTMLYGHVESYEHRVYHLKVLRDLQDETGGFNCFIPLAFQPQHNEMGIERYTFGADDLKTIAVARLFLDNFKQIKSYWVMLGQDIAQLGLHFGANDMDGTVNDEKISIMAGGRSGRGMESRSIKRLILKSRKYPLERDTLYNTLETPGEHPSYELSHKRQVVDILTKTVESLEYQGLERSSLLGQDDLQILSEHADIFTLAMTAQKIKNHLIPESFVSFKVTEDIRLTQSFLENKETVSYQLDLSQPLGVKKEVALEEVFKIVSLMKARNCDFQLSGFVGLWNLIREGSLSIAQVFGRLYECGLRIFSSSSFENESALTHREIVSLHKQAHECGLLTVAKVEINSPPGETAPIWKTFIERLIALRTLQEDTHGILGVSVEAAPDSWVTAQEYVRAIALSRFASSNVEHIIVPLAQLPTSRMIHSVEIKSDLLMGQEKYAPLLLLCGADDFGSIPSDKKIISRTCEEICSVGLSPVIRNTRFAFQASQLENKMSHSLDLRHIPIHELTKKDIDQNFYLGLGLDRIQGVENHATYH